MHGFPKERSLLELLEKDIEPVEDVPPGAFVISNAIALVQAFPSLPSTLGEDLGSHQVVEN